MDIIEYSKEHQKSFKDINVEWLTEMFVVEPYDLEVISHPEKYILSGGGNVWLVQNDEGLVIGTGALMEHEEGCFELTKMAVSKAARGLGTGRFLLKFLIEKALERDCKSLFLLTNTKCESAIYLYREEGFVDSEEIRLRYGSPYERCNLGMLYEETK
ncbi:MAG: GNAT family N-acetyltransferase [Bdellovibrionales bacterium]